jgi:tRNA-2-methylthio-N6-dimethylallyladenosine synthase
MKVINGETNDDFELTVDLMKKIKFINSYSFTFSARPGTPAFNLKRIENNLSKERLNVFQNISKKIKTQYRKTLLMKIMPVLFENKTKDGNKYFGRDEYFNSVIVESKENLIGKIKNVKITKVNQNTLFGEIKSKLIQGNFAA